jgi:hypothetical protein
MHITGLSYGRRSRAVRRAGHESWIRVERGEQAGPAMRTILQRRCYRAARCRARPSGRFASAPLRGPRPVDAGLART